MKQLFAIFGDPVAHSRSPLMHNYVFCKLAVNACYTRVHLEDGNRLKETFFDLKLSGANVTVPHKEAAFAACDEVRGFAEEVGAVNTLINEDGRLIGYNTDADGFIYAIRNFENVQHVLIIGAGGTSRALAVRLRMEGKEVHLLNRSEARLVPFADDGFLTMSWEHFRIRDYDLVINATSAGLKDDNLPAPDDILHPLMEQTRYAADVIYGQTTPFLALCQKLGVTAIDGSDMLLGQGVLANRYFTQNHFEAETIESLMRGSFAF